MFLHKWVTRERTCASITTSSFPRAHEGIPLLSLKNWQLNMAHVFSLPLSLSIEWFDISMKLDLTLVPWKFSVTTDFFSPPLFSFQWERATPCTTEQIHITRILFCILWWNRISAYFWFYMEFVEGFIAFSVLPCAGLIEALEKRIWEVSFAILWFLMGGNEHIVITV